MRQKDNRGSVQVLKIKPEKLDWNSLGISEEVQWIYWKGMQRCQLADRMSRVRAKRRCVDIVKSWERRGAIEVDDWLGVCSPKERRKCLVTVGRRLVHQVWHCCRQSWTQFQTLLINFCQQWPLSNSSGHGVWVDKTTGGRQSGPSCWTLLVSPATFLPQLDDSLLRFLECCGTDYIQRNKGKLCTPRAQSQGCSSHVPCLLVFRARPNECAFETTDSEYAIYRSVPVGKTAFWLLQVERRRPAVALSAKDCWRLSTLAITIWGCIHVKEKKKKVFFNTRDHFGQHLISRHGKVGRPHIKYNEPTSQFNDAVKL